MSGFDVVVVGGGPGGYPAAIRASQLGLKTVLFEENLLGGECTNYGCVPTKSVLWSAWVNGLAREHGFRGAVGSVFSSARSVSRKVRERVRELLESYGVEIIEDSVEVVGRGFVVAREKGRVEWRRGVVIATGSSPVYPAGLEPDGKRVLDHRGLLALEDLPGSVLIVGGGYIGVEFAYALARLGVRVSLVEIMDRPLPGLDRDLGFFARRILRGAGVEAWFRSRVVSLDSGESGVRAVIEDRRGRREVSVEYVLVATGRRPRITVSGLEELGVRFGGRGEILVDCGMRAGNGVYAAGDVTGEPMLAHKAFVQARVAAENIAGLHSCYGSGAIPMAVYVEPELVQVGRLEGEDLDVVKVRAEISSRSLIEGVGGFVKIAYDRETGIIKGISMAFHGAAEAAGEASLIVSRRVRICELAEVVHPHPTFSEVIWEVAEAACGRPRHIIYKK